MILEVLLDVAVIGLAALAMVLGVAAVLAYLYVRWVYAQRSEESSEFRRLVQRDGRVAIGGALIALLVAYTLVRITLPMLELPVVPSPWTTIAIGVAVNLMLVGVLDDARTFHRLRREGLSAGDDES